MDHALAISWTHRLAFNFVGSAGNNIRTISGHLENLSRQELFRNQIYIGGHFFIKSHPAVMQVKNLNKYIKKQLILVILNDASLYGANLSLVDLIKSHIENNTNINFHVLSPNRGPIIQVLNSLPVSYSVVHYRSVSIRSTSGCLSRLKNILKNNLVAIINSIAVYRIERLLKNQWPSVIHSNTSTVRIGFLLSQKLRLPHVTFVREDLLTNDDLRCQFDIKKHLKLMEKSDLCVFSSHFLKERYQLTSKCVVIYDLVDALVGGRSISKSNTFLVCGSLDPNKSIETVILAHAELIRSGCRCELLIAGDGQIRYTSYLKEMVENNGTEKHVKFLGYIKNTAPLFEKSIAVVVASKVEGFGRVASEAMIRSTLVIGRNTSATRELLSDGRNGILFENHESLVNAMRVALERRAECENLIANAKKFAETNFGKKRFIAATTTAYAAVSSIK